MLKKIMKIQAVKIVIKPILEALFRDTMIVLMVMIKVWLSLNRTIMTND